MLNKISLNIKTPEVYSASKSSMWNDEYISKQLLNAHLNPNSDSASRKHDFISESVKWINSKIQTNSKILDLGCGPGLYSNPLSLLGHDVVGLDLSENSIDYALKDSIAKKLNVVYKCESYLEMQYHDEFDFVFCIFCDFGVLSFENQTLLLKKIHQSLKKNGVLILDVLSTKYFFDYRESKTWEYKESGFWRPSPHLILNENKKYPTQKVILERYQIIEENKISCYHNWNKCYEKKEIINLLSDHGLDTTEVFSDVTGKHYTQDSKTMAIISKKK